MNKQNNKSLSAIGLIGAIALGVTGCASFTPIKLQSNYISAPQDQNHPEIIVTQAYKSMPRNNISVAVKAPDQCTSYTADQRTGNATTGETILKTDCGLEMGEIERSLARAGYQVISWKAFNQQIETEKNLTKAAQDLGAQIIFQINSLENSIKNLGQDARWERSYYLSDYAGNIKSPYNLSVDQRSILAKNFIMPLEEKRNNNSYTVTIDAAAIQVSNGQTIWYYRWAKSSEPVAQDDTIVVNLLCENSLPLHMCKPFTPRNTKESMLNMASGDTIGVSNTEKPSDIARAEYAKLYREVVANLVESFSTGKVY